MSRKFPTRAEGVDLVDYYANMTRDEHARCEEDGMECPSYREHYLLLEIRRLEARLFSWTSGEQG